jgi:hypothetical protein
MKKAQYLRFCHTTSAARSSGPSKSASENGIFTTLVRPVYQPSSTAAIRLVLRIVAHTSMQDTIPLEPGTGASSQEERYVCRRKVWMKKMMGAGGS